VIKTLQAFAMSSIRAGPDFEISARWIDVYSELTSEQSIAAPDRVGEPDPGAACGPGMIAVNTIAAAPVSFARFLGQI
jgi:hypothetical protein